MGYGRVLLGSMEQNFSISVSNTFIWNTNHKYLINHLDICLALFFAIAVMNSHFIYNENEKRGAFDVFDLFDLCIY